MSLAATPHVAATPLDAEDSEGVSVASCQKRTMQDPALSCKRLKTARGFATRRRIDAWYGSAWWEAEITLKDADKAQGLKDKAQEAPNAPNAEAAGRTPATMPRMWISLDDLTPRGEFGSSLPPQIAVFGRQLSEDGSSRLLRLLQHLQDAAPCPFQDLLPHPPGGWVLYHGTSPEAAAAICATGRLLPSRTGMQGPGVYLGSFWKAFKFASREPRTYRLLAGTVFRVRVLARPGTRLKVLDTTEGADNRNVPCACDACTSRPAFLRTAFTEAARKFQDHDGLWRQQPDLAGVHLPPTPWHADGRTIVKNEEFVFHEDRVHLVVEAAAEVDLASVAADAPYDPLQRSQRVHNWRLLPETKTPAQE